MAPVVYVAHIAFDLESMQPSHTIAETLSMNVADQLRLEDTDALAKRINSYRVFIAEAKIIYSNGWSQTAKLYGPNLNVLN